MTMDDRSKELKKLAKYQRQAKQGMLVCFILLPCLLFAFGVLAHWFRVPLFLKVIVIGIALLSLVGDIITFVTTSAKLRKVQTGTP